MRFLKLFIIFLIVASIPVAFVLKDRTMHKKEISIATGGKGGGYFANAQKYKKILEKEGINLKIVTTSGSIEAQNRLINKEVDFAFVQGGTEIPDKGIQALANIAYEPIWVFYHDENISTLNDLIGKRIAVGKIGSGIYPVAKNLLNEMGIDKNNTDFLHMDNSDAAFELQAKTIDAMFYVASADSKIVKKLLRNSDISLINFKDAETFRQYFIKRDEDFQILRLYASSIDLKESVPRETYTLLAKNTLLATIDTSDDMTRLLMKVVDKVHSSAGLFHKEHTFPNSSMLAFEQHPAVSKFFEQKSHFYEEHFDYWTAQSLNRLHEFALLYLLPVLTIFAFFVEVIIPTIDWYTRRKIIKWYDKINEIDTGIEKLSLEEAKRKRVMVLSMLHHVRNQDDIPASHMEEFYTLQNQIASILDAIERRIRELGGL
jgi:TRAP transporter TAXI family solute receptor